MPGATPGILTAAHALPRREASNRKLTAAIRDCPHRAAGLASDGEAVARQRTDKPVAKAPRPVHPDRRRFEDYLRFTADPAAPFDNNASQREIRMYEPRIKVSGSMRQMRGAEEFCPIRSYPQTTKKHGIDWLGALTDAMGAIPWMPAATVA